jgi:hypothetical protein
MLNFQEFLNEQEANEGFLSAAAGMMMGLGALSPNAEPVKNPQTTVVRSYDNSSINQPSEIETLVKNYGSLINKRGYLGQNNLYVRPSGQAGFGGGIEYYVWDASINKSIGKYVSPSKLLEKIQAAEDKGIYFDPKTYSFNVDGKPVSPAYFYPQNIK